MLLADVVVDGLEVEVELAEVFRLEAADLQLDGDQGVEPALEEQQIESEVLVAHLDRMLGADEAELPPEFSQKFA